jgi:hypothetical protein
MPPGSEQKPGRRPTGWQRRSIGSRWARGAWGLGGARRRAGTTFRQPGTPLRQCVAACPLRGSSWNGARPGRPPGACLACGQQRPEGRLRPRASRARAGCAQHAGQAPHASPPPVPVTPQRNVEAAQQAKFAAQKEAREAAEALGKLEQVAAKLRETQVRSARGALRETQDTLAAGIP